MHDRDPVSATNKSTLAKRAIVDIRNYRSQPTDTKHDDEITLIPKIVIKQGDRGENRTPRVNRFLYCRNGRGEDLMVTQSARRATPLPRLH
jgi:hypothetical protein